MLRNINQFIKISAKHASTQNIMDISLVPKSARRNDPLKKIKREKKPTLKKQKHDNPIEINIIPAYTPEESEKILRIINNWDITELLRYEISKARARELQEWKIRNGQLRHLKDLLLIQGFGPKVVKRFYESLLGPKKEDKVLVTRSAPFVTPSIGTVQKKSINSCVSIRVGVSSVTWARVQLEENSPCLLTHWHHHEIVDKKLHMHDLVQRCVYVEHSIPKADCYLFETPQRAQASNNPGANVDQQNINVQKSQIIAMLGFALAARARFRENLPKNESQFTNIVFYMRRLLAARLFSNLVGNERISSEETVQSLIRTYEPVQNKLLENVAANDDISDYDYENSTSRNVNVSTELLDNFSSAPRYHREYLGQSLLLNLAFIQLVLLQDPTSIASVSRNSGAKM